MKISFILLSVIVISCKHKSDRKYTEVKIDGITKKGYTVKDTIFDDSVFYYNQNDILIRKEYFKNGKLNGMAMDLYSNGKPMKIVTYSDGLKNGYNCYYDSTGKSFIRTFIITI